MADAISALQARYEEAIRFIFVYVEEAHPEMLAKEPTTLEHRKELAAACCFETAFTMTTVIDSLDNAVCNAYQGWPNRLYVVAKDGTIAYQGGPGPFMYNPRELGEFLEKHLATADHCDMDSVRASLQASATLLNNKVTFYEGYLRLQELLERPYGRIDEIKNDTTELLEETDKNHGEQIAAARKSYTENKVLVDSVVDDIASAGFLLSKEESAALLKTLATVKQNAPGTRLAEQAEKIKGQLQRRFDGRGYLGMQTDDSTGKVVIVNVVPSSPAEKSGLRAGDTLVDMEGAALQSTADLVNVLTRYKPCDKVTASVRRKNEAKLVPVEITLGSVHPR